MAIREQLRAKLTQAMKSKDDLAKNLLRLVLGEVDTADARQGHASNDAADDQRIIGIIKKIMEANAETVRQMGEHGVSLESQVEKAKQLVAESGYLQGLLPPTLSEGQLRGLLGVVADSIKSAKSEGQATGIAMKHLKTQGVANVDSAAVIALVKELRG